MRIKLLLTDVLGSSALLALRCLQQVGEHSSKCDFCREVQHTHFCALGTFRAPIPARGTFTGRGAERHPQSHHPGPGALRDVPTLC